MMMDSQKLLAEFVRNRSEAAFRELVTRYVDLVYSTAVRLVNADAHRAEDVAQMVFADLARMARSLPKGTMLGGWLHHHTVFVASTMMRGERRRQIRERQAAEMNALQDHTQANLAQVAPLLDEAIDHLSADERSAILLRFFEQLDFRSVGEALGSTEEAARKRVTRAVEKLHSRLQHKGVSFSAGALGTALAAEAVTAAPAGLAAALSIAALGEASITTATTATAAKVVAMTTMQKTLLIATLGVASATGIYEAHQVSRLHAQIETLKQRQAPAEAQIQQLQSERDQATNKLALLGNENVVLKNNTAELLRLRGEVGLLRRESQELARLKTGNPGADTESEESWLERVKLLKQKLDQTPGAKIPELQFLTHYDWLTAAKNKLDTEDDYQVAFRELRSSAIGNFVRTAEIAFQKYLQANDGQFPTNVAQMKPFFDSPPGDDLLERYTIAASANLPEQYRGENTNDWVITLKSPQDGGNWAVGPNGASTFVDNSQMTILGPAMKAAIDAAPVVNGAKRLDIHQLAPYLTTPEQKAAYEELLRHSK